MLRILFSVLAVVVALLALVLEQPILYAAAAVLLLIVAIFWMTVLRRRHQAARRPYLRPTAPPEDDLKALGIMEIRPKEPGATPVRATAPSATAGNGASAARPVSHGPDAEATPPKSAAVPSEAPPAAVPRTAPVSATAGEATATALATRPADPPAAAEPLETTAPPATVRPAPPEMTALPALLEAARLALGADGACLLRQPDVEPDFEVVAAAGAGLHAAGHTFSAPVALLDSASRRHAASAQPVAAGGLPPDALGYRAEPSAIRQVAIAPLPERPDDPAAYVLVADAAEADLGGASALGLLAQFASLAAALRQPGTPTDPPLAEAPPERPRLALIADEMQRARTTGNQLALALVLLNRAEALATEGDARVAAAERLLEGRLAEVLPEARVVRFGELIFGVFYEGAVPELEAWGERLQREFEREMGLLEGGVSVGIALLHDRHDSPEAFRRDATAALSEAYASGTCTILE